MMSCDYLLNTIYNFAEPPKKKKIPKLSDMTKRARSRQERILRITKDKPMSVRDIADMLDKGYETTRQDVRSLIIRGNMKNLSVGGKSAYFVKAI